MNDDGIAGGDETKKDVSAPAQGLVEANNAPMVPGEPITGGGIAAQGAFWIDPDRDPEVLLSRADVDVAHEDIATSIRTRIVEAMSSPPMMTQVEDIVARARSNPDAFEELFTLYMFHRFRADVPQIQLIKATDISVLDDEQQYRIRILLIELCRRSREFSLASEQIDLAWPLAEKSGEPRKIVDLMIVRGLCFIGQGHPDAESYHREIVQFSVKHGLQKSLAWAYRNWSTLLWNMGRYADSLLLSEREIELRKAEGNERYLRFLFFFSRRQEVVDASKAVATLREAVGLMEKCGSEISAVTGAEAHYAAACFLFRCTREHNEIAKHAKAAFEAFDRWVGYEIRAAWCAGLLASVYEDLGESAMAAEYAEHRAKRVNRFGGPNDSFAALAGKVLDGSAQEDDLRHLEALVVDSNNLRMQLGWTTVLAIDLLRKGKPEAGIEQCDYLLRGIDEDRMRKGNLEEDLAILFSAKADCHLKLKEAALYVLAMEKAIAVAPADIKRRWLLCQNAFVFGRRKIAEEQAAWLKAHRPTVGVGVYRILARCRLAEGDIEGALKETSEAITRYPAHPDLGHERQEISDIKLGLLNAKSSKFFRLPVPIDTREVIPSSGAASGLPEYHRLKPFRKAIVDTTVIYLHDLQRTIPKFIAGYRNDKNNLEEADFRDDLERISSQRWREIGAEARHGAGRVDLIVREPAPSLDAGVIEFKIWGRNDYKEIVSQLLGYLTEFQAFGIIFMINLNKSSIARKYIDTTVFGHPSYVSGTYRDKPIVDARLEHFYSRHRSMLGTEVELFHLILNIWQGS